MLKASEVVLDLLTPTQILEQLPLALGTVEGVWCRTAAARDVATAKAVMTNTTIITTTKNSMLIPGLLPSIAFYVLMRGVSLCM